jgi:hypothetical protein
MNDYAEFATLPLFQQRPVARSQSQPTLRRSPSPLPVSMDALAIPDMANQKWWGANQQPEVQPVAEPHQPRPVWEQYGAAAASATLATMAAVPTFRRVSVTPPLQYAAAMGNNNTATATNGNSLRETVKAELRRGMSIMGTKTRDYLHEALAPRGPLPVPVVREWDSSRPRSYGYSPIDRKLYENGMAVMSVQYLEDGCTFNLVVDGVGMVGSLVRPNSVVFHPSAFRNPLNVGPRRAEDWQVLDRNRQTRYRITRRARNYYDLQVTQGAHLGPLNRLLYVCNWYQAILQGQLTVHDERGAAAATCSIGPDTGSQMDRSIQINCAGGADHLALISTVLLGLELARQYGNDAIHPSQQNNKGKATLGFGPSVVPNMLYL